MYSAHCLTVRDTLQRLSDRRQRGAPSMSCTGLGQKIELSRDAGSPTSTPVTASHTPRAAERPYILLRMRGTIDETGVRLTSGDPSASSA